MTMAFLPLAQLNRPIVSANQSKFWVSPLLRLMLVRLLQSALHRAQLAFATSQRLALLLRMARLNSRS